MWLLWLFASLWRHCKGETAASAAASGTGFYGESKRLAWELCPYSGAGRKGRAKLDFSRTFFS